MFDFQAFETNYISASGDPIPIACNGSRSIEIFFGKFSTFDSFYDALCDNGVCAPAEEHLGKL